MLNKVSIIIKSHCKDIPSKRKSGPVEVQNENLAQSRLKMIIWPRWGSKRKSGPVEAENENQAQSRLKMKIWPSRGSKWKSGPIEAQNENLAQSRLKMIIWPSRDSNASISRNSSKSGPVSVQTHLCEKFWPLNNRPINFDPLPVTGDPLSSNCPSYKKKF